MSEEVIEKYAKKIANLSIEFARKTGYLIIPAISFPFTPIVIPLKWFYKIEKEINELKKTEEASEER